jgi:hypothetical protein
VYGKYGSGLEVWVAVGVSEAGIGVEIVIALAVDATIVEM